MYIEKANNWFYDSTYAKEAFLILNDEIIADSPSSGVRSESRWYGLACVGLA